MNATIREVNILVVDDEPDILKFISENLTVRGMRVSMTDNGRDALALILEKSPSLMVLDIKLPDLTGWELLDEIGQDERIVDDFPVLIMTASITEANTDLTDYPNVMEILIKPFSSGRLVSAVKQLLKQ